MNKKAVERDILGLLPSITLPLPCELTDLAVSLLAQSRSKASSLKPEEEIARGFACSHIACERLKQPLDLPTIAPRPPCPPRIYKKVFTYLNSALAPSNTGQSAPTTPSKSRLAPRATPNKATPSKSYTPTKSAAKRRYDKTAEGEVPDWTMLAIRTLCKERGVPAAIPHVFAGVSSIVKLVKEQSTSSSRKRIRHSPASALVATPISFDENRQIPALIAVVTMYTISQLYDEAPSPDEYKKQREVAVNTLRKVVPGGDAIDEEDIIVDIEAFMREAQNGWLEMEWYQNIAPQTCGSSDGEDDDDESEGEENTRDWFAGKSPRDSKRMAGNTDMPKRAFGTMTTDATDWLSEDRKANYKQWRRNIMKQIERVLRFEPPTNVAESDESEEDIT